MAKFKVDENLPIEVAVLLAAAGHDACTVFEQQLVGASDTEIADACRHEARAILTLDVDFSDIRVYPPADYSGIIVLRLARLDKDRVVSVVYRLLPTLGQEPLSGKLWIVGEASVRIRG
jgi:predicted nuclease of predicted toxin-antitoxin system